VKKKALLLIALVLMLCGETSRGYAQADLRISGTVYWEWARMDAKVSLALASAGLKLPTGRSQGEEIINMEFPRLVRSYLMALAVDSSSTLGDLIDRGAYDLSELHGIPSTAKRTAPSLSTDFSMLTANYGVDLRRIVSSLVLHRNPIGTMGTLLPVPSRPYTGIIILADDTLPVHGKRTSAPGVPCFFPKIWDTQMNLVYERNMVDPAVAKTRGIVRYVPRSKVLRPTPSGLDAELTALVGEQPLRILARGFFGARPTDPIIDRADALTLISLEENRRLLREGRVVLVLSDGALETRF
jgi:hypothetical protein